MKPKGQKVKEETTANIILETQKWMDKWQLNLAALKKLNLKEIAQKAKKLQFNFIGLQKSSVGAKRDLWKDKAEIKPGKLVRIMFENGLSPQNSYHLLPAEVLRSCRILLSECQHQAVFEY